MRYLYISAMFASLVLQHAPPLDSEWLKHEQAAGLLEAQPTYTMEERRLMYADSCRKRNAAMLGGRDLHLNRDVTTTEFTITARDGYHLDTRIYNSSDRTAADRTVIYYHGGGLKVGDLDSEDLSCRRICIEGACTVYSVSYRLIPEYPMDTPVNDAWDALVGISERRISGKLIIAGSSSGGQLAAQVSQIAKDASPKVKNIDGLLLRCPVTANNYENGSKIPPSFRPMHASWSTSFETSLLHMDQGTTSSVMPLEASSFKGLPPTFVQVCTNDIYYSDGICYAGALSAAGIPVKLDVVAGWPHTFWLKAPHLERALKADNDCIEGLRWLLELS